MNIYNKVMVALVLVLFIGAIHASCTPKGFTITNKTGEAFDLHADLRTSIGNLFLPCPDWKETIENGVSSRPSGLMYGCKIREMRINGKNILSTDDRNWRISPLKGTEFVIRKSANGSFDYKVNRCD